MSEVSINANAYTIQEENSTAYCTPRSHPGETPTAAADAEDDGCGVYTQRRGRGGRGYANRINFSRVQIYFMYYIKCCNNIQPKKLGPFLNES